MCAGRLQFWPAVGYQRRLARAVAIASVSPRHACHQAWIPHLSPGSRMGLTGTGESEEFTPQCSEAGPPPAPHTDVFRECSISRWSSHVCSSVYISKRSREPLSPASSFHSPHLFSSTYTPKLTVHRCTGADRGVCPLISKHSQGAYGENAAEYSLHCILKLTLAKTICQLVDVNR